MASELKAVFGLSATSGQTSATVTVTDNWVLAQGSTDVFVSVGTTEESLSFADIPINGWVQLYNSDASNYVDWGFSTGVYGGRLEPGKRAQFFLKPSATVYVKANTAACLVRVVHFGDAA